MKANRNFFKFSSLKSKIGRVGPQVSSLQIALNCGRLRVKNNLPREVCTGAGLYCPPYRTITPKPAGRPNGPRPEADRL